MSWEEDLVERDLPPLLLSRLAIFKEEFEKSGNMYEAMKATDERMGVKLSPDVAEAIEVFNRAMEVEEVDAIIERGTDVIESLHQAGLL